MIVYESVNECVLRLMPGNVNAVLDIGCGTGSFGRRLKEIYKNIIVHGVTYSMEEKSHAEKHLDKVIVEDINSNSLKFNTQYDCVILSHVLEHTLKPKNVYENVINNIRTGAYVLVAVPNVLFYKQRLKFLLGDFTYSEHGGLMDETHYHFFSWSEANKLVKDERVVIEAKFVEGASPLFFLRKILHSKLIYKIDSLLGRQFPGLFGLQFCFLLKKVKE